MSKITLNQLLEAGVHFGHQVHRWNPKMRSFIYGQKGGVHIFDLTKTLIYLEKALEFVKELAKQNKVILFVGTKKQAQKIIQEAAQKCQMPYINRKWLGGTLTNFVTMKKQIKKLNDIENEENTNLWSELTKKEKIILERKLKKLKENIEGIKSLTNLPDALFIVDINKEYLAVSEAKKLNIPIIAICDTNVNPDDVDYPIPGNDDAIKSLNLLVNLIAEEIIKNKNSVKKIETQEIKKEKILNKK